MSSEFNINKGGSERIIALAQTVSADHIKAAQWLHEPGERLNGNTPMSLLDTQAECQIIEQMLIQIDEAIYS